MLTEIARLKLESRLPLHRQLYEALRRAILDGKLPADDRLPSSRSVMQDLNLSRNTVVAALSQLAVEGYLVSRVGSGTYVKHHAPKHPIKRSHTLVQPVPAWSKRGQLMSTVNLFSVQSEGARILSEKIYL